MTPLNGNSLLTVTAEGLVASSVLFPVLNQDTSTPKPKPKEGAGKGKPKGKPQAPRKLIELEREAIKRIAKIDPKLAKKLKAKLPTKKTALRQAAYIRKRVEKLEDEIVQIKGMEKSGISRPERKKAIGKLISELDKLFIFYTIGVEPKWFKKLKEKQKKEKKPTGAAGPAPTPRPVVASLAPGGILLTFASTG